MSVNLRTSQSARCSDTGIGQRAGKCQQKQSRLPGPGGQALKLAPEDRAVLADRLEQSLPFSGFASEGIARAWAADVAGRIDAYERGEATAISFDVAMTCMRLLLHELQGGTG